MGEAGREDLRAALCVGFAQGARARRPAGSPRATWQTRRPIGPSYPNTGSPFWESLLLPGLIQTHL
eukprot:3888523-Alexandrium_andersonii.AAC.1